MGFSIKGINVFDPAGIFKQPTSSSVSQTNQEQTSAGASLNSSNSSSLSGGTSSSLATGNARSNQSIFGGDLYSQLYGGALNAASAIDPTLATQRNNQLFTGGASIIDQLSGGGAGADYLTQRLTGGNDALNAQIDAVGADLGRFFNEQLNPAITGSAVASGTLGGGRQGVAQGMAINDVTQQFATQAANLRATDLTNRDNAALGLLDAQNKNATTALGSLSGLSELGSGAGSLDVYSQLSQIFGGPTALTQSSSQNMSTEQANQYATSLAQELGISYDEAHALLQSTGSSNGQGGSGSTLQGLGSVAGGLGSLLAFA